MDKFGMLHVDSKSDADRTKNAAFIDGSEGVVKVAALGEEESLKNPKVLNTNEIPSVDK